MRCFFPVNGRWGGNIARPPVSFGTCEDNGFAAERQIFPRFSVRRTVCRAVFPGVACGAGLSGRFSRGGICGPVFAGAFVGRLLPGRVSFRAVLDSASCRALIVRLAEGTSQSRSCRASLGLADGSEPSGRGGTTMRLFVRRGFGPGRLLTGSGFGPGAAFDRVFFVRRGFGSGRR